MIGLMFLMHSCQSLPSAKHILRILIETTHVLVLKQYNLKLYLFLGYF